MIGSKDPLDWNIRVRGWAFSKRSNRRKRLVMSKYTEGDQRIVHLVLVALLRKFQKFPS